MEMSVKLRQEECVASITNTGKLSEESYHCDLVGMEPICY